MTDMQVNLMVLLPLLMPSCPGSSEHIVSLNNFFLDDGIIVYQLKLLWFNRNTMFVKALTSPGFTQKLAQVLEDYESYTKDNTTFVSLKDYFSGFLSKNISAKEFYDHIYMDVLKKTHSMFGYHLSDPFAVFFESSLTASTLGCDSFYDPPTMKTYIAGLPFTNTRDYIILNWDMLTQQVFEPSDFE